MPLLFWTSVAAGLSAERCLCSVSSQFFQSLWPKLVLQSKCLSSLVLPLRKFYFQSGCEGSNVSGIAFMFVSASEWTEKDSSRCHIQNRLFSSGEDFKKTPVWIKPKRSKGCFLSPTGVFSYFGSLESCSGWSWRNLYEVTRLCVLVCARSEIQLTHWDLNQVAELSSKFQLGAQTAHVRCWCWL